MPTLLLIDASSYLYRAFHAMPDLRTSSGVPTGALRGMLAMLRHCVRDFQADYVACVFDAKGKTFRDDWYPAYKANRSPMPEDLVLQIEVIHHAITLLGLPILSIEGVEADDVIGTLALQAQQAGLHTIISTGDKDMAQLVNAQVCLMNTMTQEKLDADGVLAKFGVRPEQIVDYLSLVGDTVDNVPGVAKVGPKTAVKWLDTYQNLETIIHHADEISGVVGQNLRDSLDWLPQAKRLVTIKTDVHLDFLADSPNWAALAPQAPNQEALHALYQAHEFKSWLNESSSAAVQAKAAAPIAIASSENNALPLQQISQQYVCINDIATLQAWIDKLNATPLVALDTETTGLNAQQAMLVGISFAIAQGEAAYLPLMHNDFASPQIPLEEALTLLRPWLEDASRAKVGQNITYDQHIFANHGIQLAGIAHDTMLQSYVLHSHERHNMDDLAAKHLHYQTIHYAEVAGKGAKQIGFEQVPIENATQYAAEDADITLQLHQVLYPKIQENAGLQYIYQEIELPTRAVLWQMERNGVLIDSQLLASQGHELGQALLAIEQKAHALAEQPFNLNSPKQVQGILFEKLAIPSKGIKKTASGGYSTDEEVLQQLAADYPLPKILLEYRGLAKLKSTYVDKLPQMRHPTTGRIHTHYGQAIAVTGRLSSSEPNLQNIPVRTPEGRRIRAAFIAEAGAHIISADYSQIELRIMAHLSQDAGLLKAFAQQEDVHNATAAEIFDVALTEVTQEQRRYAKTINFGLIYGMSAFGLANQLEIGRDAAQHYINRYFMRYPQVAEYMQNTREIAKKQGFVETVFGRRLWLPNIHAKEMQRRQGAERAAINAPMQGTAADLIKLAMIAVQNWLHSEQLQTRLTMQVHDELVLEVPEHELILVQQNLAQLMQNVAQLRVPLLVTLGTGKNWDAAH